MRRRQWIPKRDTHNARKEQTSTYVLPAARMFHKITASGVHTWVGRGGKQGNNTQQRELKGTIFKSWLSLRHSVEWVYEGSLHLALCFCAFLQRFLVTSILKSWVFIIWSQNYSPLLAYPETASNALTFQGVYETQRAFRYMCIHTCRCYSILQFTEAAQITPFDQD